MLNHTCIAAVDRACCVSMLILCCRGQNQEQRSTAPVLKPYSPMCDSTVLHSTVVSPALKSPWSQNTQQQTPVSPNTLGVLSGQKGCFIRTVPMQNVQSHYAAPASQAAACAVGGTKLGSDAVSQQNLQPTAVTVDRMAANVDRIAFRQASAQPFAALLSLSPESSDNEEA